MPLDKKQNKNSNKNSQKLWQNPKNYIINNVMEIIAGSNNF